MVFLTSLGIVVIFVILFQKPLVKYPMVFYTIAFALVALYIFAHYFIVPVWLWRFVLVGIQRCSIALALFVIVMYTSVFTPGKRVHSFLQPMRRQLSILGAIFSCGHIAMYSLSFFPRIIEPSAVLDLNLGISFFISLIITVMLTILTITSFVFVRNTMRQEMWLRVQKLAYPFFMLIYVHLILVLGASALQGNLNVLFSLIVYTLLFGSYFALRSKRLLFGDTKVNRPLAQHQVDV